MYQTVVEGSPYPKNKIMHDKIILTPLAGSGHIVIFWIMLRK